MSCPKSTRRFCSLENKEGSTVIYYVTPNSAWVIKKKSTTANGYESSQGLDHTGVNLLIFINKQYFRVYK